MPEEDVTVVIESCECLEATLLFDEVLNCHDCWHREFGNLWRLVQLIKEEFRIMWEAKGFAGLPADRGLGLLQWNPLCHPIAEQSEEGA